MPPNEITIKQMFVNTMINNTMFFVLCMICFQAIVKRLENIC
jgi:hypothetical protein